MEEKTTRELEWFDLETRMRELLHTILEPILNKAREDRESSQNLKNYCKSLESRVKSLETSVFGDQNMETIIENIYKRCGEIEGNRKKDVVDLEQSLLLVNEAVNSFEVEQNKFREEVKLLVKSNVSRENEIAKINGNIESHKAHVLTEIDKLSQNFQEMNRVYQEVALKTEEQAIIATAKATANSLEMGNYKREIDTVRKDVVDSLLIVKEIKGLKLNIDTFEAEMDKVHGRFMNLSEQITLFRDELEKRDLYLDKYIPLQTAILISDYLHNIFDNTTKKKIADYENLVLKELNMNVLDSRAADPRSTKADRILHDMQHVEERKVEFQTKEIMNPAKGRLTIAREKLQKKPSLLIPDDSELPPENLGLSKPEVEKIVQSALTVQLDAEIGRLKSELNEKIGGFRTYLKTFNSEASSMHTQFMNELETVNNTIKLMKSDFELDFLDSKKYSEEIKKEVTSYVSALANLTQLSTCLYEYTQIEQLMQKQDEEDRHSMALTMEKDMQNELAAFNPKGNGNLTSANFSFQKKCLSCGTANSMFSGFRTSIVYHPSPLLYRNKKFERHELLSMKGQMLKKCWENVAPIISLKHEENFDRTTDKSSLSLDKSYDRHTKFSRLGSIDEADSKINLPLLVSPSARTGSNHRRNSKY